jgi:hypothetical protein
MSPSGPLPVAEPRWFRQWGGVPEPLSHDAWQVPCPHTPCIEEKPMTGPPSYPPYNPYPPYPPYPPAPPVRPSRPWQVEWVWGLMIGVTAMCGVVVISDESLKRSASSFESSGASEPSAPYATYGYLAVLGLYLLFAFQARSGRSSARIGAPIMTVLVFLVMTPYCWLGYTDAYDVFGPEGEEYGPAYAVLTMVALAISVAALVLIYLPASNAYFRYVRVSRIPPPPPRRW